MAKVITILLLLVCLFMLLWNTIVYNPKTDTGEYSIDNVRIYKGTLAWDLAKAVNNQDTKAINVILAKNPAALDYQDPLYGTTLLFWSVGMEKYNSAETLLKAGANPDIISVYEGVTALYIASGYSYIDTHANKDPKFVELLLRYGADPNIGFVGSDHYNSPEIGTTPLMESIGCGIGKTKALVAGGADINFSTDRGMTASLRSIWIANGARSSVSVELEVTEYAYYLIVENHSDISKPWLGRESGEPVYPVIFLRDWFMKLDDKGYQRKMEIIDEFNRQGFDYWSTPISNQQLLQIQRLYPNSWKEYIKRY